MAADSTTMLYIFMGVINVLLFIVVGSFMVIKQRRLEAKEGKEAENLAATEAELRSKQEDAEMDERMRKIAKSLEEKLENPGLGKDDEEHEQDDKHDKHIECGVGVSSVRVVVGDSNKKSNSNKNGKEKKED